MPPAEREEPAFIVAPAPAQADTAAEQGELALAALAGEAPAAVSTPRASSARRRIVAAAALIMIGQLLSSVLGMVRSEVINILFYGVASGAFLLALKPVQMLSDLIIAGSVSGALIPTFVDLGEEGKRDELRRVYSTVLNVVVIAMAIAVGALIVAAPFLVPLLANHSSPQGLTLAEQLVPLTALALFGLGLYAVGSAVLYALKDVVFPAFATGIQHVGVVLCGVIALVVVAAQMHLPGSALLTRSSTPTSDAVRLGGAHGLAIGIAVGALAEFVLLLPGLRRGGVSWRPVLHLRHPAVRQMLRLYAPVAGFLLITVLYQFFDLYLQGHTPGNAYKNITALATATTLIQFPVGLVAAALAFAVLPPLTAAATRGDGGDFKRTLGLGFRLGLLLMVPAMVGLIVLRMPILTLLFQHGQCDAGCTYRNSLALQNYAYELPFIALDQLLIAAFYARKNTLTPALVGVLSIGFYLALAIPFSGTIGMPVLALGDAAKNSGHAIVLFILLTFAMGNLGFRELAWGALRICAAAAAMGVACAGLLVLLPRVAPTVFGQATVGSELATILVITAIGAAIYFGLVTVLGIDEVRILGGLVRRKLGRA